MSDLSWSFYQIANDAAVRPEREVKPRDYLWATDLGNAPIDTYLKLMGEPYTNPPNDRSCRKFHAGDIWEFYAYLVLYFAGVLRSSQDHLEHQYKGLLKVTGRQDFLAGGVPDWEKARQAIKLFPMTDPIKEYFERMVKLFESAYGNKQLKEIVIECKSVSSFMFPRYQNTGKPNRNHEIQTFHYLISQGYDEGHIAYISKDDSLMLEFGVFNPSTTEEDYKKAIELLTGYYNAKQQPPIESEIIWDEDARRFNKNWRIEYSPYLYKLYGYETPESYRARWDSKVAQFNRVLKRVVTGANITAANLEVIKECRAYFPNFEELVIKAKETASLPDEEDEEL